MDEAGSDECRLLVALAAQEDDATLSRLQLIQAAGLDPGRSDSAVKAALRHDLIVEEDGNFRLAVPLMRRWIRPQSDTRDTGACLSG